MSGSKRRWAKSSRREDSPGVLPFYRLESTADSIKWVGAYPDTMSIEHNPTLDAREPQQGDIETFEESEPGDLVKFFEWPVEPLTVIGWEEDDNVGKRVRVEAEGGESFLY